MTLAFVIPICEKAREGNKLSSATNGSLERRSETRGKILCSFIAANDFFYRIFIIKRRELFSETLYAVFLSHAHTQVRGGAAARAGERARVLRAWHYDKVTEGISGPLFSQ